ncbi:MAG TPA: hypothetical protein VI072_32845 [Polyangiaceae bacterium]
MRTLSDLVGTHWKGTAELWLDPLGNDGLRSDCTLSVEGTLVRYTWSHEGKPHEGRVTLHSGGAEFTDTWHQPEPTQCLPVPAALGLFQVQYDYGPAMDWHWRIGLSLRPTGELVVQMTNITPWGEEGRAVRMICERVA